jgi:hypothetical protein
MPAALVAAAVVLIVLAAIVVGCILAGQRLLDKERTSVRNVPWSVLEQATGGNTVVAVVRAAGEKQLQRIVVAQIPDGAQDWTERLFDARGQAVKRAAALNGGQRL